MVLVTGGTGLVGAHLILRLLQAGVAVKAIHRKTSDLKEVKKVFGYYTDRAGELFQKIIWIEADLNDLPALDEAFKDVAHVYHCAGLISFDPNDYDLLRTVNTEGTKNIVNLCLAHSVRKLCHVSSIAAIGRTLDGQAATEETDWTLEGVNVYALSKIDSELEVWRGSQEGLAVAIINPGVIIGPGFWDSGTGLLFRNGFKARKYYPPGGTGFVTVNDVTTLMIDLMNADITNEKFIAVAENLSYRDILGRLAKAFNKPGPSIPIKFWQMEVFWRVDKLLNILTKRGRRLTKVSVKSLRNPQLFDNSKSKEQLGHSYGSLDGTIAFCCKKFMEEYP
ncbi:MAG TPA: NAD-dependent epimerase/dehydratase family protein [Arenibacter sp.]|nr:NAD-dependent epimerase/dehydratase family protein [Arenibacter sp.]